MRHRSAILLLILASASLSAAPAAAQYYGVPGEARDADIDAILDGRGATLLPDALQRDMEPKPKRRQNERRPARFVEIPRDADPAWSTRASDDADVDPATTARRVADPTGAAPGQITIDTKSRKLYLSLDDGDAIEYGVGVGRMGFAWKGEAKIGRKAFWPGWTPPREMLLRRPELPDHMEGGLDNPLGARALYLFDGNRDTMFRIHGTNEPDSIGKAVSSGCIRMLNADVIDLYGRVGKGTRVVVR